MPKRFTMAHRRRLAAVPGALLMCLLPVLPPSLPGQETTAPASPEVAFFIGRARAFPGDAAKLVLSVRTGLALRSISIALDFDESKVRVVEVRRVPVARSPDGNLAPPEDLASTSVSNLDQEAGNQLREGWIHVQLEAPGEDRDLGLPKGELTPLLEIAFLVLPGAPLGFSAVEFQSVGPSGSPSTYFVNRVEVAEAGLDPRQLAPAHLQGGGIEIIGEVGFFMRGDANHDRRRDISDPITTLSYLFLGGVNLPCADAADANDDGILDLSDPIFTLAALFQAPGSFPAPEEWGLDPTPDRLDCLAY